MIPPEAVEAMNALVTEVKFAHANGIKYYRDGLIKKYGHEIGEGEAGNLIDFTVLELDTAASVKQAHADQETAAAMVELLTTPPEPTISELIATGALIDPKTVGSAGDLRPLALYLIDARRPVSKTINAVGRANKGIAEADRLTDEEVIALVNEAAAEIATIRRREKAAAAARKREKTATDAAKLDKLAEISDKMGAKFLYLHPRWGPTIDAAAVAEYLHDWLKTVSFKGALYVYRDGIYTENTTQQIEAEIKIIVGEAENREMLTRLNREVLTHLLATDPAATYPFNQAHDLIPVLNGVVQIDYEAGTAKLLPHSPDYRFTYQLPVTFDPVANGNEFHRCVIGRYLNPNETGVLYQIPACALLQMAGWGPYKRAYILCGAAHGGKSTYLDWLAYFFGDGNISQVSLYKIGADRFATAPIEGRILNTDDELEDVPLKNVGTFKKLLGSFNHAVEKKHENQRGGRITAVHIFACNSPPDTPERVNTDPAFWDRWIFLSFDAVFDLDPRFRERWFTDDARSGFLNRVIQYMIKIRRDGLIFHPNASESKEAWTLAADPFARFVNDETTDSGVTDENMIKVDKEALHGSFLKWCKNHSEIPSRKIPTTITAMTQIAFKNGWKTKRKGTVDQYLVRRRWIEGSPYKPAEPAKKTGNAGNNKELEGT